MSPTPWARRRAVYRAIRTGALLHDPDEAKLALRTAASMRRRYERARRWPVMVGRLVLLGWVAADLALALARKRLEAIPDSSAAVAATVLAADLWSLVQLRRKRRRAAAAERRHRAHLQGLGLLSADEVATLTTPPKPRFRPALVDVGRLCYASVVLAFFLLVPLRRRSPWWYAVHAVTCTAGIALSIAAGIVAWRAWRRHGEGPPRPPRIWLAVALVLTTAWWVALVDVLDPTSG